MKNDNFNKGEYQVNEVIVVYRRKSSERGNSCLQAYQPERRPSFDISEVGRAFFKEIPRIYQPKTAGIGAYTNGLGRCNLLRNLSYLDGNTETSVNHRLLFKR